MRANRIITLVLSSSLLCLSGCGSEVEKLICPAKGLGVETPGGRSCSTIKDSSDPDLKICQDQLKEYKKYGCDQPQICPDVGSRRITDFEVGKTSAGETISFVLTNCSTGNQSLIINKVVITGDDRCFFQKFNKSTDIQPSLEILPGENSTIITVYKPTVKGEDHAHIRVFSNAQNFNPLVLPVCGLAVPKGSLGKDAGPGGDASVKVFTCKNVGSKVNTKCH